MKERSPLRTEGHGEALRVARRSAVAGGQPEAQLISAAQCGC